jgi:nitrous oxidase accessory protein
MTLEDSSVSFSYARKGRIIYVDDDNINPPYEWDGSLEHPYPVIQLALEVAMNGDTIFVFNGTYYGSLHVDKTVTMIGEEKNSTFIKQGLTNVVEITANRVNITGFTVMKSVDFMGHAGIKIESNGNIISGNIIRENFDGIAIYSPSINNWIEGNVIINNKDGISLFNTSGNIIFHNYCSDNAHDDITLLAGRNNIVTNNTIMSGIELQNYETNTTISGNIITECGYNGNYGVCLLQSSDNMIIDNVFLQNHDYCIVLLEAPNTIISGNTFLENVKNATFYNSPGTIWWGNYWDRPRLLPRPIYGVKTIFNHDMPWIAFDWHPAKEPLLQD